MDTKRRQEGQTNPSCSDRDGDGSAGHGVCASGQCAGSEHNNSSGNGVPGERACGVGNVALELACVCDGNRAIGGGWEHDGDDWTGRICEREPGSEPGSNAGWALLHGNFLFERWNYDHAVLGDGNGGRIAELEPRIESHEENWQRAEGFLAAASVVFAVIEVALEAWYRR